MNNAKEMTMAGFPVYTFTRKTIALIIVLLCLAFNIKAWAEPQGTCWGDNITYLTLPASSFASGKAGTSVALSFSAFIGGQAGYVATCQGVTGIGTIPLKYGNEVFSPSLIMSNKEILIGDYLKITDVQAITYNGAGSTVTLPSTVPYSSGCGGPSYTNCIHGSDITTDNVTVGLRTLKFNLVLTKDIVGGLVAIPSIDIIDEYLSTSATFASQRANAYVIQGTIIPVPQVCVINNGNVIDVDFGTIQANDLAVNGLSSGIRIDKSISISCNNGLTQTIEAQLIGVSSNFESDAFMTTDSDIGVEMIHDGAIVGPMGEYAIPVSNGEATTTLSFVPVKNGNATLKGGDFSASAVMVLFIP